MAKSIAEINAEAQAKIDDLKLQLQREKSALKANRISVSAYNEFKKSIKRMMNNVTQEADAKIKVIRMASLPDNADKINEKMKADFERRNYEKFMKAAESALEDAITLKK